MRVPKVPVNECEKGRLHVHRYAYCAMMYCPIVRLSHVASLQPPFGVLQSGSDMQHKRLLNATARFLSPGSQDAIANTYIPLWCAHIESSAA